MALQDILDAIVADADGRIAEATATHRQRIKDMREESERAISRKRQQISEQRDQKKRQMKEKAESHARMVRSKAILSKKQACVDAIYADVLKQLANLPAAKAEAFLSRCFSQVRDVGTIRPAAPHAALVQKLLPVGCTLGEPLQDASGGFLFVSDKTEQDFTYEFLVREVLRPKTEIQLAADLFSATVS